MRLWWACGQLEDSSLGGRFGYFLIFFCSERGKGESEAPGGGRGSVSFFENPRRGGGFQGQEGLRGLNAFFRGRNVPPSSGSLEGFQCGVVLRSPAVVGGFRTSLLPHGRVHSGRKFLPTDSLFFEFIWQKLTDTDTDTDTDL